MFWLNTKRILRAGVLSFWRNGFVSLSSILVVTVTLFTVISLIFTNVILEAVLSDFKDKVDVNVYFVTAAPEADILQMKSNLEKQPEVASVVYVSRDKAIAEFKDKHKDDYLTLQALNEIGDNPLGARLNVVAKDPSQYEGVAKKIESQNTLIAGGTNIIDKVNFRQNKDIIDRLTKIIAGTKQFGYTFALVLFCTSLLITFNTIRLVIYMTREEINVMRLVGASSMYVRGPFIVGGMMYGAVSALLAMILFYPITLWLTGTTQDFFGGVNLYSYYLKNFFQIFIIVLLVGMSLGAVSSFLAVRKYLKV
ncbi:MAG: permease-like cell division protein FtsX [Candidatus Parcubacteria bacterium]|nr:permease-like cell division protein FtsX [Candidatus Parcubacteria bacterium]